MLGLHLFNKTHNVDKHFKQSHVGKVTIKIDYDWEIIIKLVKTTSFKIFLKNCIVFFPKY